MGLKDLQKLVDKAKKDYEHGIVKADRNKLINKITFDSPQLTYMFGGFSYDRIHQSFGPESSGKSSVYTYIAGQLQKKMPAEMERLANALEDAGDLEEAKKVRNGHKDKQVVLYLDFERTFDPEYATKLGMNCDEEHLILVQANCMEDAFNMAEDMVKTGCICCVIFDSDAAAPTNLVNESDYGTTGFNGAKTANVLAETYKKFNIIASNYMTPLLVVSQERDNMCINENTIVEYAKLS